MRDSFQQFDQNLDGGWRVLRLQRDYAGAAHAIRDYLKVNSANLDPHQKGSLEFHLGHVYAMAGKRERAIRWLRKSLASHWVGNPAYINAYIAFLENDKASLLRARHVIATTNQGPWTGQDLNEIDAMIRYFDAPFEAAWGDLNCHDPGRVRNTARWRAFCKAMDSKYRDLYAARRSRQ